MDNTPSWRVLLREFLLYKKADQRSERTLEDYEYHISRFFRAHPKALTSQQELERGCLEYLAAKACSPYYFNNKVKYLRAFFEYLKEKGIIPANPLARIHLRRVNELPRPATEEALEQLLSLPDRSTFAGLRDYALIMLTLDAGIRPKEAFGLLPSHFDLDNCRVEVPMPIAKDRESRILPILPQTALAVKQLINARHPNWPDTVPVFCSENGRPLSRQHWARRMRDYSERLGVKVKPYQLRHSFATIYLRNGGNAFALKDTLGHSTLEMTKRYVMLVEQDLQRVHQTASPLHRLLPSKGRVRHIKLPK